LRLIKFPQRLFEQTIDLAENLDREYDQTKGRQNDAERFHDDSSCLIFRLFSGSGVKFEYKEGRRIRKRGISCYRFSMGGKRRAIGGRFYQSDGIYLVAWHD
jgi:hypothetical protein